MVDDPAKLFNLACDLLTAAEACLTDNAIALPDQRYISPCQPDSFCCSNLVVVPGRIEIIEEPNSLGKGCLIQRRMHFDLWIERCVHVFTNEGDEPSLGSCAAPDSGTVAGDALKVLTDRWVLLQCLVGRLRSLGSGTPWCCAPLSIVEVEPICEGLCAGTRFNITLTI